MFCREIRSLIFLLEEADHCVHSPFVIHEIVVNDVGIIYINYYRKYSEVKDRFIFIVRRFNDAYYVPVCIKTGILINLNI